MIHKNFRYNIQRAAFTAIAAGASTLFGMQSSRRAEKRMERQSAESLRIQLEFQKEQRARLDKQKKIYEEFEFTNPYANVKNYFGNIENPYEDLTVNQKAAEFQMEQASQQRANVMQQLRGAAGTSGIAALAQTLAQQSTKQAQMISADIAKQEQANMQARAKAQLSLDTLERKGASSAELTRMGGEAMVQQAEASREATLLGIEYGGLTGANMGAQQAYANQMSSMVAAQQMQADRFTGTTDFFMTANKLGWFQ